jgi:cytochrome b pre-mRNA-processing protein 3
MIFKIKKHNLELYNTLLELSRNKSFYNKIGLKDIFETRIYLMFFHFSIILIIFKKKVIPFPQKVYDNLFHSIENNLRELGFGDVSVNKKMKDLNKILYDILLKVNKSSNTFLMNEKLVKKYFAGLHESKEQKYAYFDDYFTKFYHFCFEIDPKIVIKEAIKFRNI